MATKKSGGSSTNGRDSAGRRLGIKKNGFVKPGQIIVRQRGTKYHIKGYNVGIGRDHTIYSKAYGMVRFLKLKSGRVFIYVEEDELLSQSMLFDYEDDLDEGQIIDAISA